MKYLNKIKSAALISTRKNFKMLLNKHKTLPKDCLMTIPTLRPTAI